uniref:ZP domain-containing protein n=1 Tax=Glossina austeni TaxID=7395 RepID=A0A1A9VGA6_GLOAU
MYTHPCADKFIRLVNNYSTQINCKKDYIKVDLNLNDSTNSYPDIYLENLKDYPVKDCQAIKEGNQRSFRFNLKEFHQCGLTKSKNLLTGLTTYYHRIVLNHLNNTQEFVHFNCTYKSLPKKHHIIKRDLLPEDFVEDELVHFKTDFELTDTLVQQAPEPEVLMQVKQNNEIVTGNLTIVSGTPLLMEIKLNEESAKIYGLKANFLEVGNTLELNETILFNGCTVDPYLFDNFNLTENEYLLAKFRAFKFPDSSYVQFRANVQICLNKCQPTQCSNGQTAYGRRRRRELRPQAYEISLNTLLQVKDQTDNDDNKAIHEELQKHLKDLRVKNLFLKH